MESRWKEIGNKLERIGELAWCGWDCKGSAVMRGRAGDARLVGQMVCAEWFFVLKTGKYGSENDGGIGKILKDVNKCLNRC